MKTEAEKLEDSALREHLGMIVREEWIAWANEQPSPKPSWLVPWDGLSEPDKEVDRRIGERLYREGMGEAVSLLRTRHLPIDAITRAALEAIRDDGPSSGSVKTMFGQNLAKALTAKA